jgi:hypothetical protein
LERPLAGVAIESVDGAVLSGITIADLTMHKVRAPIFVRLGHRGGNSPRTQQVEPRVPGQIKNVVIRNVSARQSMFESSITGIPGHCVQDVTLESLDLEYEGGGKADWVIGEVPDESRVRSYPEAQMFGRLPAYGFFCRHVRRLEMRDTTIRCQLPDARPMLVCDDVGDLFLECVDVESASPPYPVIWLKGTGQAEIRGCHVPDAAAMFVAAEGDNGSLDSIQVDANEMGERTQPLVRLRPGELLGLGLPLFRQQSTGRIEIDASAMRLLDPLVSQNSQADGQSFISVPHSGMRDRGAALCRVEIENPGEYEIWVRAFGDSGETDSFYAAMDGSSTALADLPQLGRWHWCPVRNREQDGTRTKVIYQLDAGTHTLRIGNRESGTRIQTVVLVRTDARFQPEREEAAR